MVSCASIMWLSICTFGPAVPTVGTVLKADDGALIQYAPSLAPGQSWTYRISHTDSTRAAPDLVVNVVHVSDDMATLDRDSQRFNVKRGSYLQIFSEVPLGTTFQVLGQEDVSTPAGYFKSTVKLRPSNFMGGENVVITYWLAPGVGMVQKRFALEGTQPAQVETTKPIRPANKGTDQGAKRRTVPPTGNLVRFAWSHSPGWTNKKCVLTCVPYGPKSTPEQSCAPLG